MITLYELSSTVFRLTYRNKYDIEHIKKIIYILCYLLKDKKNDRNLLVATLLHHLKFVGGSNEFEGFTLLSELDMYIPNLSIVFKDIADKDSSYRKLFNLAHDIENYITMLNNQNFYKHNHESIKQYISSLRNKSFIEPLLSNNYEEDLNMMMKKIFIDKDIIEDCCKIMICSLNIESNSTVIHTITTEYIAEELSYLCISNKNTVTKVKFAAAIHDIGKLLIPIHILEKKDKLSSHEFEIIKKHSKLTRDILTDLKLYDIRDIASLHHERLDGSGYSHGLLENDIPFETKLITVSDIVSAMIYPRPYKKPSNKIQVIQTLNTMKNSNKLDRHIVEVFIINYDRIMENSYSKSKDILDKFLHNEEYRAYI